MAAQAIPEALVPPWLTGAVVTLAWTWRLERGDGAVLGFTTHDRPLRRDGLLYRAAPGMTPSAIRQTRAIDRDTMDIAGMLTADAIRAADLDAGRWDGARVTLGATDWSDADAPILAIACGTLGEVERSGAGFAAELRGQATLLDRPVVPRTTPGCRARLGDQACRVDLAPRRHRAMVASVAGTVVTLDRSVAPGALALGRLRWLDGPLCGRSSVILAHEGERLELAEAPFVPGAMPVPMTMPVPVALVEGCDGRLATCAGRFANAVNFQGEPHLPGIDLLTRYGSG